MNLATGASNRGHASSNGRGAGAGAHVVQREHVPACFLALRKLERTAPQYGPCYTAPGWCRSHRPHTQRGLSAGAALDRAVATCVASSAACSGHAPPNTADFGRRKRNRRHRADSGLAVSSPQCHTSRSVVGKRHPYYRHLGHASVCTVRSTAAPHTEHSARRRTCRRAHARAHQAVRYDTKIVPARTRPLCASCSHVIFCERGWPPRGLSGAGGAGPTAPSQAKPSPRASVRAPGCGASRRGARP